MLAEPSFVSNSEPASSAPSHAEEFNCLKVTSGMTHGDESCFDIYYDAHFDLMVREARRLIGRDEATCMDIVQDAFLKVIKSIRPFDSRAQLEHWSRLIVRTTALDFLRKRQRRRELPSFEINKPLLDNSIEPQLDLARMIWIEEQLRDTDPKIRKLISLRYRLGWSLQEIGSYFGIKTGAVDGRIRRAVLQLKEQAENSDEV